MEIFILVMVKNTNKSTRSVGGLQSVISKLRQTYKTDARLIQQLKWKSL